MTREAVARDHRLGVFILVDAGEGVADGVAVDVGDILACGGGVVEIGS